MSTPSVTRPLDARGRRRSPAACPGFTPPRPPATKGRHYPPDPPTIEDIARLLQACHTGRPGRLADLAAERLRSLIVVMWRTGLRVSETIALEERDLAHPDRSLVVRHGKGGKRRIVAMDEWGWTQLERWITLRRDLPVGQVFCVLSGPTAGRAMYDSDVRRQLREATGRAGLRRRIHPHSLRHAHACELMRDDISVFSVMTQLGHARPDTTVAYLRGMTVTEVLSPIAARKPPMMIVPT